MSDTSYWWSRRVLSPFFWTCSRPVLLHTQRAAIAGGYILAPNHLSHFDPALVIRHAPRHVDFMAVEEVRRNRWVRSICSPFNTFYVDRNKSDSGAVRTAVRRLRDGRVVGIFPEGGIRAAADSVLNGGPIHLGVARIAAMAGVPVMPCVVLGAGQFVHRRSWLPLPGTRYGIIFGSLIKNAGTHSDFLEKLRQTYRRLSDELRLEMKCEDIA